MPGNFSSSSSFSSSHLSGDIRSGIHLKKQFFTNLAYFSEPSSKALLALFGEKLNIFLEKHGHQDSHHGSGRLYSNNADIELGYGKHQDTALYIQYRKSYLHSRYNPLKEAEREISALRARSLAGIQHLFYLGADLLYCLERFCSRENAAMPYLKDIQLFIFSPCNELFFITLLYRDLNFLSLFQKKAFFFDEAALQTSRNLAERLAKEGLAAGNSYFLERPISLRLWPELLRVKKDILQQIQFESSKFLTRYFFEKRWIKNTLSNSLSFTKAYPFSALRGRYIEKKALILGAGPSLDFLLDEISSLSAQKDIYLICVDTALGTLLDADIIPDFIISLDAGYYNSLDFFYHSGESLYTSFRAEGGKAILKPALIAYFAVYPSIVRDFAGDVYFFAEAIAEADTNSAAAQSLIQAISPEMAIAFKESSLPLGSGVLQAGIAIGLAMGFKSLSFYGCDFCMPFYQSHSQGSIHSKIFRQKESKLCPKESADFQFHCQLASASNKQADEDNGAIRRRQRQNFSNLYPSTANLLAQKKEFLQAIEWASASLPGREFFLRSAFPGLWSNTNTRKKAKTPASAFNLNIVEREKDIAGYLERMLEKHNGNPKQKEQMPENCKNPVSVAKRCIVGSDTYQKSILAFKKRLEAISLASEAVFQILLRHKNEAKPLQVKHLKEIETKYAKLALLLLLLSSDTSASQEKQENQEKFCYTYLKCMLNSYIKITGGVKQDTYQQALILCAELRRVLALSLNRL